MDSHEDKQKELQQREEEIKAREQAMRLRELEAEIYNNQPPLYQTTKQERAEAKFKIWLKKTVNIAKFFGFVIGVIVAVRIAYWLALMIMIGGVSWIGYKLFLESDESDRSY